MASVNLPLHDALQRGTRLGWLASSGEHIRLAEAAFLVGCGVVAAVASQWLDFGLRIPGHAILRVVIPMGLGLALVPRRGAGTVMGISGLMSGLILGAVRVPGGGLSLGALTSLALTGSIPLREWAATTYLKYGMRIPANSSLETCAVLQHFPSEHLRMSRMKFSN